MQKSDISKKQCRFVFYPCFPTSSRMTSAAMQSPAAAGVTRYQLAKQTNINYQIIDNYYKNKVVRYDSDVLDRICKALQCKIEDILTFEED